MVSIREEGKVSVEEVAHTRCCQGLGCVFGLRGGGARVMLRVCIGR